MTSYLRCCAGCSAWLATGQTGEYAWCDRCRAKVEANADAFVPKKGDRCRDSRKTGTVFRDLVILSIENDKAFVRALGDPDEKCVKAYWAPLNMLMPDRPNPY